MPKLLSQVLTDAFSKAGVAADNAALLSLIQKKELSGITVEDEILTPFESNLHSEGSAEAKLKSKLWAEAYNAIDAELESLMPELGIDDTTKSALASLKSTPKKVSTMLRKVKELEAAKKKADPVDKEGYTKQINDLNQKISDSTKASKEALDAQKNSYEQQITDLMFSNMLGNYNLHIPDNFTKEDIMTLAAGKLKAAMSEAGELRITRENGQMKLVKPDGTDYFDKTNTKKDLKSFTESTLAHYNLLQTANTGKNGQGNNNPAVLPGTKQPDQNAQAILNDLDAKIKDAMAVE